MPSVYPLIFNTVFFVNIIVGMALNAYIVLANCKTWIGKKCLPPGDKIVTSLCLSRWIFQCLLIVHQTLNLFFAEEIFTIIFTPARILLNYISIWLASLLCVYYCVKITNYKHAVFLYLKTKMSTLVPWCLGLSVFLSLLLVQPYVVHFFFFKPKSDVFYNVTKDNIRQSYTYFIGSSPPLLIFAIAFFLTVPSLWRHIKNMNGAGISFRSPEMKTHYNAIKSMAAFFLLHSLFIAIVNVNLSGVLNVGTLFSSLTSMLISFYPCLHSAVIIFYNRQLRHGVLVPLKWILNGKPPTLNLCGP